MKTKKKKKSRQFVTRGFFGRLIDLVTKNWWLKVLSLILAFVIYHSLKPIDSTAPNYDRHAFQRR